MATPREHIPEGGGRPDIVGSFEIDPETGKAKRGPWKKGDSTARIKRGTPEWDEFRKKVGELDEKFGLKEAREGAVAEIQEALTEKREETPAPAHEPTAEEIIQKKEKGTIRLSREQIDEGVLDLQAERLLEGLSLETPEERTAAKERMKEFIRARGAAIEAYERENKAS